MGLAHAQGKFNRSFQALAGASVYFCTWRQPGTWHVLMHHTVYMLQQQLCGHFARAVPGTAQSYSMNLQGGVLVTQACYNIHRLCYNYAACGGCVRIMGCAAF
jgi:hypothetical protein